MAIQGSLSTMSLSDLLQVLAAGRKTGLLKCSHARVVKGIYFENGTIVGSSTNDPRRVPRPGAPPLWKNKRISTSGGDGNPTGEAKPDPEVQSSTPPSPESNRRGSPGPKSSGPNPNTQTRPQTPKVGADTGGPGLNHRCGGDEDPQDSYVRHYLRPVSSGKTGISSFPSKVRCLRISPGSTSKPTESSWQGLIGLINSRVTER